MTTELQPSIGIKEAIEQRRATRAFRSDPIPKAILEEILRLGLRAPSGYNLQPWRFILLQDLENKAKLRACAFDQRQVTEAPVVLICCGESPLETLHERQVNQPDYIESVIDLGQDAGAMDDSLAEYMRSPTNPIKQYGGRFNLSQVCYRESYGQAFQL